MTEKTINCAECGNSFTYTPNPKYTDRRKYCFDCGTKKNMEWIKTQEDIDKPDITPEEETKSEPKTNGYKLTEENIRIGALSCTIESFPKPTLTDDLFYARVKEFEEYIRNGK